MRHTVIEKLTDDNRRILLRLIVLLLALATYPSGELDAQAPSTKPDLFSKWRPTREFAGGHYVGNQLCLQCHKEKVRFDSDNAMARAAERGDECASLSNFQNLTFRNGPYLYNVLRKGPQNYFVVTDGREVVSARIRFCFGQGKLGQTYVLEYDGTFYESRLSYYRQIGNLDFTILHNHSVPPSLRDALGRPLTPEAVTGCFSCHTTGATEGGKFEMDHLAPGVGCEACHGPGDRHVIAMKAHSVRDLQIFMPEKLDSDELTQEFCGACHRGFEQVLSLPGQDGINNIRYQPYRIFNSPGHKGDVRISCVACHNPHNRLERDESFYDAKCLACHLTKSDPVKTIARSAPACPSSDTRCVSCHMQKVDLPGAHAVFTDHWIRVVKPGEQVPR